MRRRLHSEVAHPFRQTVWTWKKWQKLTGSSGWSVHGAVISTAQHSTAKRESVTPVTCLSLVTHTSTVRSLCQLIPLTVPVSTSNKNTVTYGSGQADSLQNVTRLVIGRHLWSGQNWPLPKPPRCVLKSELSSAPVTPQLPFPDPRRHEHQSD